VDEPDIQIGALVKAKRLRFKKKPETEVRVDGEGGSGSVRENLPETVEPGVTYRDVRVAWLATAGLDPTDRKDNSNEGGDDGEKQRT
jgi:hypothetical protein